MLPPPDQIARIFRNMSPADRARIVAMTNACEGTVLDIKL